MYRSILFVIALTPYIVLAQQDVDPTTTAESEIVAEVSGINDAPRAITENTTSNDLEEGAYLTAREDLDAQKRMAVATEEVASYALGALWLTAIGLVMLLGTLFYTAKASRHTKNSIMVLKDASRRELRAYMVETDIFISENQGSGGRRVFHLEFVWQNQGITPARSVFIMVGKPKPFGWFESIIANENFEMCTDPRGTGNAPDPEQWHHSHLTQGDLDNPDVRRSRTVGKDKIIRFRVPISELVEQKEFEGFNVTTYATIFYSDTYGNSYSYAVSGTIHVPKDLLEHSDPGKEYAVDFTRDGEYLGDTELVVNL